MSARRAGLVARVLSASGVLARESRDAVRRCVLKDEQRMSATKKPLVALPASQDAPQPASRIGRERERALGSPTESGMTCRPTDDDAVTERRAPDLRRARLSHDARHPFTRIASGPRRTDSLSTALVAVPRMGHVSASRSLARAGLGLRRGPAAWRRGALPMGLSDPEAGMHSYHAVLHLQCGLEAALEHTSAGTLGIARPRGAHHMACCTSFLA